MRARRVLALARYAVAGTLRTPYTWVGAILLPGLTAVGLYSSARRGAGWVLDPSFLFDGAILAAVFGIRSGLITQRTTGLQTFLRANFVSPAEHMAAAILSLAATWLAVCSAVFILALVLPGAGLADAAWHATVFALRTGVLVPFVIVAESFTTIQLPFFLPGLAYVALVMVLVVALGEVPALTLLAPPVSPATLSPTHPAVLRLAAALGVGFPALVLATHLRAR